MATEHQGVEDLKASMEELATGSRSEEEQTEEALRLEAPLDVAQELPATMQATHDSATLHLVREYGVIHLKAALAEREQKALLKKVGRLITGAGKEFHLSSGRPGEATHCAEFHVLGELLYTRSAKALAELLTPEEMASEPALRRIGAIASGEKPARVNVSTCIVYPQAGTLGNHCDCAKPLYTMSLSLGAAIDFSVGKATRSPLKNERSGKPVTLCMESGDAIFFDGGSIPHAVDRIHPRSTAPGFFDPAVIASKRWSKEGARLVLLFREADGWAEDDR